MNNKYINIYNNLVNLTRNKTLYKNFHNQDTFSDRLIFFLFHFGFFLKIFKKNNKKKTLQEIYDYTFKQLELSVREMGYGDVTINQKMKTYINTLYAILHKIDNWENLNNHDKDKILTNFLNNNADTSYLVNYFDNYMISLSNSTLNSFAKGVINSKF
tara:strand:- start:37 stop:510 length:474 start_codon:yes stop_codon:yes gene_type:complete